MAKRKLSEREELKRQAGREMAVYKRDDMIQKARFSLTLQEQKCILYAISKIKPTDTYLTEYVFDIRDFYTLCGIEKDTYTELKKQLIALKSKCWWLLMPDGETESAVSWFDVVRTNKKSGKVTVAFHRDMMPYLIELAKQAEQGMFYTGYNLQFILPMSSRYSPRLYEILKSYQKNNREWFFELEDLKKLLDCQNYTRWPDFRRFALEPAVEEINKYTDLNVAMDTQKEGRKVTRVIFYMAKKGQKALLEAKRAGVDRLDGQLDFDALLAELQRGDSVKAQFWAENPIRPEENEN